MATSSTNATAAFGDLTRFVSESVILGFMLGAGLLVALLACALFGWLLLLVPAPRLKSVAQIVEMVPLLGLMFAGQVWPSLARKVGDWLPEGSPLRRNLGIALPVVAVVIAAMGLRALSGDYLIRVASIAHGGGGGRTKPRRSRMGDVVARLLGGPPARAGFAYTARMMRRDWAFRRQLISIIPCAISPAILLAKGVHTDPFSGQFSAVHVIPHVFGIVLFLVAFFSSMNGCVLLAVGIVGEYVGRIYEQVKDRPLYLLKETSEDGRTGKIPLPDEAA